MPHQQGAGEARGDPARPGTCRPISKATAPPVMGRLMRNDRRAAASREKPRQRPAVMVAPDRDTPGASASGLGRAEEQGVAQAGTCRRPASPPRPVGPEEDEAEHDQEDADEPLGLAEVVEDALEHGADGGGGHGREQEQPRQPAVVRPGPSGDRVEALGHGVHRPVSGRRRAGRPTGAQDEHAARARRTRSLRK